MVHNMYPHYDCTTDNIQLSFAAIRIFIDNPVIQNRHKTFYYFPLFMLFQTETPSAFYVHFTFNAHTQHTYSERTQQKKLPGKVSTGKYTHCMRNRYEDHLKRIDFVTTTKI